MRKPGIISVTTETAVAFHDVDLAQVVWHGHYLKYLENARWALLDFIGFGLDVQQASGYAWPIVDLHVKYVRALRFGDRLAVRASLVDWQRRLCVNYLVTRSGGERVARAQTVQAGVHRESGALQLASPPILLECVEAALRVAGIATPHSS